MDVDSIYLYLSNEDKTVSSAWPYNFSVTLPKTLWLESSKWEMALHSISYEGNFITSPPPKLISVCCDAIESSIIHSSQAQILRRLINTDVTNVHWDFEQLQYKKIIISDLSSVRVYLLDEKGNPAVLGPESWVYCTLHLRKKNTLL